MNKEEIIKYCLTLENTYKDCPFSDDFESVLTLRYNLLTFTLFII